MFYSSSSSSSTLSRIVAILFEVLNSIHLDQRLFFMYLNHFRLRSVLSGAGLGSQKQRSRPKSGQEHAVVGVAVVDIPFVCMWCVF